VELKTEPATMPGAKWVSGGEESFEVLVAVGFGMVRIGGGEQRERNTLSAKRNCGFTQIYSCRKGCEKRR